MELPDPIPQHREPLFGTRPDMVAKYPTHDDKKAFWRLPTLYKTVQDKNMADKVSRNSRSSSPPAAWSSTKVAARKPAPTPWLAELQQEAFVKSTPRPLPTVAFATAAAWAELAHRRTPECAGPGHRGA